MKAPRWHRLVAALTLGLPTLMALPLDAAAYSYGGTYTFAGRWNELTRSKVGSDHVYSAEHLGLWEYDVCPPTQARSLFPSAVVANTKQTCDNLWKALLNSPYLLGSASTVVRARDMSEDFDLNFVDPSDNVRNHYFNWYINSLLLNTYVLRILYPLNLAATGPQAGAYVVNNPNVLAMGDDAYVMLDADGSLSYYAYLGGGLLKDSAAKTFTNGSWAGQTLTSKLQHMIGYEEFQLYFLEGASTLHVFDRDLKWVRTDNVKLGNELSAYSLGDLVDNKVPGYTYIGWDAGPVVIGVTALRPVDHFFITTTVAQVEVGQTLTITIQGCEDSSGCATPYTRGITGNLTLSNGAIQAFTIPRNSSSAQVSLPISSLPADGMLTVALSSPVPSALGTPGTLCRFGASGTTSSDCRIPVMSPLKHVELSGPATGLTCAPSTFTIRACGSTDCLTPYAQGLTGTVVVGGSGTVASPGTSVAFTIAPGQSSTTLALHVNRPPSNGVVPLSITGLSATASDSSALYCALGTSATGAAACNHQVTRSGFLLQVPNHVAEASGVTARITAIKSNADQSACVPAFTGNKAITLSCTPMNPTSSSTPLRVAGLALNAGNSAAQACDANGRAVTLTFLSDGTTEAALAYADVGRMRLRATMHGTPGDPDAGMAGEITFTVSPAGFLVERPEASPGAILAGNAFSLRVRAVNSLNAVTTGFGRIDTASGHPVALSWALSEPTGIGAQAGTLGGTGSASGTSLSAADFGQNGEVTVTDLRWSEVGRGKVSAQLSRATGFLDSGQSPTGQSTALGPFVPAYFEPSLTAGCGSFSYSGQPLAALSVTARNVQGGVTRNFDGSGALLPVQASAIGWQIDATAAASGGLSGSGLSADRFTAGVGQAGSPPSYTFNNKLSTPLTVLLGVSRSDGATSSQSITGNWPVRSGRLVLNDAYGSERTPLDMVIQAQHWSGRSWVINGADSCTRIPSSAVGQSNHRNQAGQAMTAFATPPVTQAMQAGQPQAVVVQAGQATLRLSAPPAGVTGTVDVALNLGSTANDRACVGTHPSNTGAAQAWLRSPFGSGGGCSSANDRDPGAKATFGVFSPESRRIIHTQDLY